MWLCRESCIVNGEAGTALPGLPRSSALETETCAPCPGLPPGMQGVVWATALAAPSVLEPLSLDCKVPGGLDETF